MTLKKPLLIASLSAAVALGAVSTKAEAADPLLGALIGGGIGAAIGHDVNRHHGGAVGGVIGAVIGSSIAADSNRYYGDRYYGDRYYDDGYYGERYYAPAPSYGYYAPAPSYYYAPPVIGASIVYSSGPRYGSRYYGGHRGYRDHRRHW
jgi:hypothetical protein